MAHVFPSIVTVASKLKPWPVITRSRPPRRLPEVGEIEDTAAVKVKVTEPEAHPLLGTCTLTSRSPLGPANSVHTMDVVVDDVTLQSVPPIVTLLPDMSKFVPVIVMGVPAALPVDNNQ